MLTVNAGSSSLKLALVEDGERLAAGDRLEEFAEADFDCSSHRVVHGGARFTQPAIVDDDLRAALDELSDLAPLHTPPALAALDAVRAQHPDRPAVVCFDTAFHAELPAAARTYALPSEWIERYGIRRYGFHGLSHAYVARRAAELAGRPASELRIVSCHLGAGASLCAIANGRSVDTTMGFTPLAGLVMASRAGDLDPGLLVWLQRHAGLDVDALDEALEHRSGLTGLAGTGDMRELLARADAGDERASLAYDVYIHRLRVQIGAMVAAAGGLDVLAFTGGVGENSPRVRDDACAGLAFASAAQVVVIAAGEDLELAAQADTALTEP